MCGREGEREREREEEEEEEVQKFRSSNTTDRVFQSPRTCSASPSEFHHLEERVELGHHLLDELARRAGAARARVQDVGQVDADARHGEVVRHGARQAALLQPLVEAVDAHFLK